MPSYTSDFQVILTHSAQQYRDAVAHVLSSSSPFQSCPLFASSSHPSIPLLTSLCIDIVPCQSSGHFTDHDLWQLYGCLLEGSTPFPEPHELYRLMGWYKDTLPHMEHIVIALDEDCFYAAVFYAAYHKLPLIKLKHIDMVKDIVDLHTPAYLTLLAASARFSHDSLQRLYKRIGRVQMRKPAWQHIALGLLTGRDPSSVSWSVLKATLLSAFLRSQQYVVTLHTGRNTQFTSIALYGQNTSFEQIIPVISKDRPDNIPDLLLIESHGGEHYIHLNAGVLCGLASYKNQAPSETASLLFPSCACGQGCFKSHALPAYRITARHIFANTCNSLQLSPTFYPDHYSLGLNAIDSLALTYVGTTLLNDGKSYEIFLYAAALRAGMTVGEAVCLLNNIPKKFFPTNYTYLLAGNPQSYALQHVQNLYQVSLQREAEQCWHITIIVEIAALITLDIPWIDEDDDRYVVCKKSTLHESISNIPDPLYFTFISHNNHMSLYLYPSEGYIAAGTYHFTVSPLATDVQARVNRALHTCQNAISTHLLPEQFLKNRVRQIEQLFTRLGKQISHVRLSGATTIQSISTIEQTLHALEQQLQQGEQDLLLSLIQSNGNRLYPYHNKVLESFEPSSIHGSLPCLCGNDMTLRAMRHVVSDYQLLGGFCAHCGVVYHGPDSGVYTIWHHIALAVDGQEWIAEILFHNTTSYTVTGFAGIVLLLPHLPKVCGHVHYHPQQLSLSLTPGETKIQQFRLCTQGLIPLDYELIGYFVADLAVYCMHRELFLASGESTSVDSVAFCGREHNS